MVAVSFSAPLWDAIAGNMTHISFSDRKSNGLEGDSRNPLVILSLFLLYPERGGHTLLFALGKGQMGSSSCDFQTDVEFDMQLTVYLQQFYDEFFYQMPREKWNGCRGTNEIVWVRLLWPQDH